MPKQHRTVIRLLVFDGELEVRSQRNALLRFVGAPRLTFVVPPEVCMMTLQQHIRTVMTSSRDTQIINLWLERQPKPAYPELLPARLRPASGEDR